MQAVNVLTHLLGEKWEPVFFAANRNRNKRPALMDFNTVVMPKPFNMVFCCLVFQPGIEKDIGDFSRQLQRLNEVN